MNKSLLFLFSIFLILAGCSKDSINETEFVEEIVQINLETFIPSENLDNTANGKFVGVIGHHTNRSIHGKIYINAGYLNQFNALVKMTNGQEVKFEGTPQNFDHSIIRYESSIGNFTISLDNYTVPISTQVQLVSEDTEGYITVKKTTKGVDPYVLVGTYEDSTNPSFNGNWDLIGNNVTNTISVTVPSPIGNIAVQVPTQNIATLSISHTGSTDPLIDTNFEPNAAENCIEASLSGADFPSTPLMIPSDIPSPLGGFLGGEGSISSGGQTSLFNGSTASWSLSYGDPIPAAGFEGGFTDDACNPSNSGTWSWNGRSGTISIDGI